MNLEWKITNCMSDSFKPNQTTRIFLKQVRELKSKGIYKRDKEFAASFGFHHTAFSNVMNNRRDVPDDVYKQFTEVYEKQLSPQQDAQDELLAALKENNSLLRMQNKDLKESLQVSSDEILKLARRHDAYIKAFWIVLTQHRAATEQLNFGVIESNMDKILSDQFLEGLEKGNMA